MQKITLITLLFWSVLSFSQDRITGDPITFTKNWIIKAGFNAVDNSGKWKPFDFTSDESTSAFSNPFALGVEFRFANANSISLFGSLNKWKANEGIVDGSLITEDQSYASGDLSYKFYFDHFFFNANWLDLYFEGGLGLFFISENGPFNDRQSNFSQNLGAGSIIWFSRSVGLNLQAISKFYRIDGNNKSQIQYFAGLTFRLYKKDFDRDGIINKNDQCPMVAGLLEFNGCPDTDGDGIEDTKDLCPENAGKPEFSGCPDTDNDGIVDADDKCPDHAGTPENNGCPIPEPLQEVDPGIKTEVITESGQPSEKILETLNEYAKTILFDYSKSFFKEETYTVLQSITQIIKTYPDAHFIIEGHTDSLGSNITNDRLSNDRANAVRDYLISNGIDPSRLTAIGYGERRPKFSNATKGGRDQNRRVEVKLKK